MLNMLISRWSLSHVLFQQNQPVGSESDDDIPQLSAHTLAALQEFYAKEKQRQESEASQENQEISEDWVC